MARIPFFTSKRELIRRIDELESRSYDSWDLKGTTLNELIASMGGGVVSKENAMKFTAVLAAVSLRSELLASFPKIIYSLSNGIRTPDYAEPLYKILAFQPNPYMNAFTFWELVNTHLDLWGNAYVYITKSRGAVSALTPVHPRNVELIVNETKLFYRVNDTGDKILDKDHPADRFLHFKDISFDGLKGQSRISLANDAISIGQSAEKFGKDFFDKGGHAKGIIKSPSQMSPEAYKNLTAMWNMAGNHGVPVLDMGKEYQQLNIPMADAQFIATREFQMQDIARVFRVPPHLLADLSRATFSNIESLDIQFVKYGLRPMVKRYEMELENKLLGDQLGNKIIRFNLEGILRGDTSTRADYLSKMVQSKIFNRNEAREIEGKNPVPGGDVFENPATSTNNNSDGQNN